MRLNQLRDLVAVVESGSVRAAGRTLGVASTVLTRSVRELEKELGIQLIERSTHGVIPTTAGRIFLGHARLVQNELGRMKEAMMELAGSPSAVTFGASPAIQPLLAGALTSFRRQYPSTEVRIVNGFTPALLPPLREGRFDFALASVPRGARLEAQFKSQPLFRLNQVVVARRGHPLAKAKSLRELLDADWLVHTSLDDPPGHPGYWFKDLFAENGLPLPRSVVYCDGIQFLTILMGSDVISTQTRHNILFNLGHDLLEIFQLKMRIPASFTITSSLLVRAGSTLKPAAAAMVAAIKAEARKLAFSSSAK